LPDRGFSALDEEQRRAIAAIAAGFIGLLSLFNIGGRFFWASVSDQIGRRATYGTFFLLGIILYALAPTAAHLGSKALFVAMLGIIISMYGGGFATVPAYLADIFGTRFVGAIHGRLLTAWSTAGIIGPVIVDYIREAEIAAGVPREHVYDVTLYVLSGLLVLGFVANLLIRPLAPRWFMPLETGPAVGAKAVRVDGDIGRGRFGSAAALAWLAVGLPLVWGVSVALTSAWALFR
jgi:MFS family permease